MKTYDILELELILEEVSKLPRTTDTTFIPPDLLDIVEEHIFHYGKSTKEARVS